MNANTYLINSGTWRGSLRLAAWILIDASFRSDLTDRFALPKLVNELEATCLSCIPHEFSEMATDGSAKIVVNETNHLWNYD
jgi:hypothetical protein